MPYENEFAQYMPDPAYLDQASRNQQKGMQLLNAILSGEFAQMGGNLPNDLIRQLISKAPAIFEAQSDNPSFRGDPNWIRNYVKPGGVTPDMWGPIHDYALKMGQQTDGSTYSMLNDYQLNGGTPTWIKNQLMQADAEARMNVLDGQELTSGGVWQDTLAKIMGWFKPAMERGGQEYLEFGGWKPEDPRLNLKVDELTGGGKPGYDPYSNGPWAEYADKKLMGNKGPLADPVGEAASKARAAEYGQEGFTGPSVDMEEVVLQQLAKKKGYKLVR